MSEQPNAWSDNWEQWFSNQYDLTEQIDRAIAGLSDGKGDGFRVALYSAVIEHAAERMRGFISDVSITATPIGEGG